MTKLPNHKPLNNPVKTYSESDITTHKTLRQLLPLYHPSLLNRLGNLIKEAGIIKAGQRPEKDYVANTYFEKDWHRIKEMGVEVKKKYGWKKN